MDELQDLPTFFKDSAVTHTDVLESTQTNMGHGTSRTTDVAETHNDTSELPPASEAENPAKTAVSSPLPFPTEIMLQILEDALDLPNGIHSDRWSTIKQARLDKFSLLNKEMSTLVPEAFYKHNKIIVKPTNTLRMPDSFQIRPFIAHPNVDQSMFVRELELRPHMWNQFLVEFEPQNTYLIRQVAWLEELASGALGFERLDTLRIVLDNNRHDSDVNRLMLQFIGHIKDVGPLAFSAKSVEIVVDGHSCSQDEYTYKHVRCTKVPRCRPSSRYNGRACSKHKRLSELLLVKPRDK